jgi:hypothetical protein
MENNNEKTLLSRVSPEELEPFKYADDKGNQGYRTDVVLCTDGIYRYAFSKTGMHIMPLNDIKNVEYTEKDEGIIRPKGIIMDAGSQWRECLVIAKKRTEKLEFYESKINELISQAKQDAKLDYICIMVNGDTIDLGGLYNMDSMFEEIKEGLSSSQAQSESTEESK